MKTLLKVFALSIIVWPMFPKVSFGFYEGCISLGDILFSENGEVSRVSLCLVGEEGYVNEGEFDWGKMVEACESGGGQILGASPSGPVVTSFSTTTTPVGDGRFTEFDWVTCFR